MAALLFMDWVGITEDFNITPFEKQLNACPDNLVKFRFLESLLKYLFMHRPLLLEAMTHGSYLLPDLRRCYQVLTVGIILHIEIRY
jgi:endoribonuclease Dicer